MDDIQLRLNGDNRGSFVFEKDGEQSATMDIAIQNGILTVFHTEVAKPLRGQGIASRLLSTMAAYARKNKLAVVPRCSYVRAKFKSDPQHYEDIWSKTDK